MSVHHRRACSQGPISFGCLVLGRMQQLCVGMQLRGSDGGHVYSAGPCALEWMFYPIARSIASATRHFEAGFGRVSPAEPRKHRDDD